ncbi:hypothetical protein GCM10007940_19150 [Portibacter lacus]|uniref:Methyltransferase domain-containing protein n=2 Tax=Portibacter lacus TaxID=1099794 RepID=A0AA37SSP2_9BACT|nr:hypothetical protein GCM10007940_19150 [Portibacter lacus]
MDNLNKQNNPISDAKKMQALYDAAPYSEVLNAGMQQSTPLLINWINAVCDPGQKALSPHSRILVAGCGAGEEVFMLAQLFPNATIVGVDFSPRSIEKAKEKAKDFPFQNVTLEIADLMSVQWTKKFKPFDFIICRGVADYVSDPDQLMKTLTLCLQTNGVLCMMMNTPFHPARIVRKAFADLGIRPDEFTDSEYQRKLLQQVEVLMSSNSNLQGFSNAPKTYLDVDFFPSIAHHDPLETWIDRGRAAELVFAGSMDAPIDLLKVFDDVIPILYKFGKAELSLWFANLSQRPGIQILFRKVQRSEPVFKDLNQLWEWKPILDESLGNLPIMNVDLDLPQNITLRFHGLPDFVINCKAYDIEVLRRCDGHTSLKTIQSMMNANGDLESLRATLFRAYHYALIS